MSKYAPLAPHWATASLGHPADTALGNPLAQGRAQRSHPQRLESGSGSLGRLVAGRFVTAALAVALLVAASLMAL